MSKSLADNPFITEAKDKNGDKWYHQIILEKKDEEIERLNGRIKEVRKILESKKHCERLFGGVEGETFTEQALEILNKGEME